jgi:hypothetical protein
LAFLFCCFFPLPLPSVLHAEIIQLKNGNTMEAKVLKEDEKFVTVQIRGGKIKIPKNDIQVINRGSIADPLTAQEK